MVNLEFDRDCLAQVGRQYFKKNIFLDDSMNYHERIIFLGECLSFFGFKRGDLVDLQWIMHKSSG